MKTKIFLLSIVLSVFLTGCKDGENSMSSTVFSIIKSETLFNAEGGTGFIETNMSGINAVSDKEWCQVSVSGSKANITVEQNIGLEGRTAVVILKQGKEMQRVAVLQNGDVTKLKIYSYDFPKEGGQKAFHLSTKQNYQIDGVDESWLSYTVKGDSIVFTAKPLASKDHIDTINVIIGEIRQSAVFRQFTVEGTYAARYNDGDGQAQIGQCVITKNADDTYNLAWQGMPINASFKAKFANASLSFMFPIYLGQSGAYHVYLAAFDKAGYYSTANNLGYGGSLKFNQDSMLEFTFNGIGNWTGRKVDGIIYAAFNLPLENEGSRFLGAFGIATDLILTKK